MQHHRRSPRQCEGKKRFTSQRAAQFAVRYGRERGEDMHSYPCPLCKAWHVGH